MITEIKFYSDSSFDVSGSMETKQIKLEGRRE